MMTAAAIDRLVHHSVIIELNIPSYRVEHAKKNQQAESRPRANEAAAGRRNEKHRDKRAVEMAGLWKAWKAKSRLPPLSTSPLEISPRAGEIPTFPQLREAGG